MRVFDTETCRNLRKKAGLTQAQLAERCGVTENTVGRLERGQLGPSPDLLKRVAGALGVEPSMLWSEIPEDITIDDEDERWLIDCFRFLDPPRRGRLLTFTHELVSQGIEDMRPVQPIAEELDEAARAAERAAERQKRKKPRPA